MLQECYECFKSAWSVFKFFFDDVKDILEKVYDDGDDIFKQAVTELCQAQLKLVVDQLN